MQAILRRLLPIGLTDDEKQLVALAKLEAQVCKQSCIVLRLMRLNFNFSVIRFRPFTKSQRAWEVVKQRGRS